MTMQLQQTPTTKTRRLVYWAWGLVLLTPVGMVLALQTFAWVTNWTGADFLAAGPPGGPPVSLTDVLVILFAASVVSMAAPTLAVVAATRAVREDEPGAHTVRTTAWIVFGISIGGLGPLGLIVWGPVLYLGLRHGKTRSSA